MKFLLDSESQTKDLGQKIGSLLCGGETIELIGDVGAGKTTLTKGIAAGLGIDDDVQSPSFTINRVYSGRDNITMSHYDFYRLSDAGIMADELGEVIGDSKTVTIIEWAESVKGVLPGDRIIIKILSTSENGREIDLRSDGVIGQRITQELNK